MRLYKNRRGALEGLPLYLIILVVIAAVVIVILLGWLSTLNKPEFGNADYVVAGSFNSITSNDATFYANTPQAGECKVVVPLTGIYAINVTTYDTKTNTLGGVIVALETGTNVLNISAGNGNSQTTNSGGTASFETLSFIMEQNQDTGTITLSFSYSGGVAQGESSQDIAVNAPFGANC